MKAPESLETLVDYGIIQEVVRPLMSGKEAQVYVVLAGGQECVAKVYKDANQRTFKHRSDYTEGRRTRNTRDQRAVSKRSQHGRKMDEDAWRTTEVEMIYRLRDAGVRVPEPLNFVEGVLVMELVKDGAGNPAPRLGDLTFSPSEAREIYQTLIREVVRMLCAGVVHGDLSDFNVLMSDRGPVVIDFPQSVDPTHNPNSQKLLLRDVENLHRFLARFAPDEPMRPYGEEIWSLFQANRLAPDTELNGRYEAPKAKADTEEVMALIEDADRDNRMRRGERDEDDFDDQDGSTSMIRMDRPRPPLERLIHFAGSSTSREGRSVGPPQESLWERSGARVRRDVAARHRTSAFRRRVPRPIPPGRAMCPQHANAAGEVAGALGNGSGLGWSQPRGMSRSPPMRNGRPLRRAEGGIDAVARARVPTPGPNPKGQREVPIPAMELANAHAKTAPERRRDGQASRGGRSDPQILGRPPRPLELQVMRGSEAVVLRAGGAGALARPVRLDDVARRSSERQCSGGPVAAGRGFAPVTHGADARGQRRQQAGLAAHSAPAR